MTQLSEPFPPSRASHAVYSTVRHSRWGALPRACIWCKHVTPPYIVSNQPLDRDVASLNNTISVNNNGSASRLIERQARIVTDLEA